MGRRVPFSDKVALLRTDQRIKTAKELVNNLTYRIQDVIELHVANEIILYSSELSEQIPESLAAHAFDIFQDSQFKFEIIKLVALWDKPDDNTVSIPTVIALINDSDVIQGLVAETFNAHADRGYRHLNPASDPEIQKAIDDMMAEHNLDFAKEQSDKAEDVLTACIAAVQKIVGAEKTESIRNLRDYAAHSFTKTRRDKKLAVTPMKYGEEKQLFLETIRLIEDLYCWVNGTSFDISGACVDMARRNAEDLWKNCHFDITNRKRDVTA